MRSRCLSLLAASIDLVNEIMNPTKRGTIRLFNFFLYYYYFIMAFTDQVFSLAVLETYFSGNLIHQFDCQLSSSCFNTWENSNRVRCDRTLFVPLYLLQGKVFLLHSMTLIRLQYINCKIECIF